MNQEAFHTPRKLFQKSPTMRLLNQISTPNSLKKKGKFSLIPVVSSPSPCAQQQQQRFPKIVNPFEQHLAERLHLPVICSPSLFHRPSTPQHSTQFEWTIDEVSSLAPANLEVSEQQFLAHHDPELEERAQAAIQSFFKEHDVVPSPADCPLRNQKIIIASSGEKRRVRNGACQTVLSLPPSLPRELEEALRPFMTFNYDQQQSLTVVDCDTSVDYEARDASLRRKLFETSLCTSSGEPDMAEMDLQALSPPPKTPEVGVGRDEEQGTGKRRNFCSPFGQANISSPNISISPVKCETFGSLSPISKLAAEQDKENISPPSSLYRSTPEPSGLNMSLDGIIRGGELAADDCEMSSECCADLSYDEIYVSASQPQPQQQQRQRTLTPLRPRRHSSKNLSHSFSLYHEMDTDSNKLIVPKEHEVLFYRSDSGFNELSGSVADVSMRSEKHF